LREALDDQIHPAEAIDDHQVDEATAQDVLDQATKEEGGIELAFGGVLDPGGEDVEQEQREEKLNGIWLNCGAVIDSSGVELSG
jgi:hypothetical protein